MLAERWFGIGSVVLAVAAAGFALRPPHHHHRGHGERTASPLLTPLRCSDAPKLVPPPPMAARDDDYASVIRATDVDKCLTTSARVDMLISISRDGHFKSASHRPEKETDESRCIAKALTGAVFPTGANRNDVSMSLRYSFTK